MGGISRWLAIKREVRAEHDQVGQVAPLLSIAAHRPMSVPLREEVPVLPRQVSGFVGFIPATG